MSSSEGQKVPAQCVTPCNEYILLSQSNANSCDRDTNPANTESNHDGTQQTANWVFCTANTDSQRGSPGPYPSPRLPDDYQLDVYQSDNYQPYNYRPDDHQPHIHITDVYINHKQLMEVPLEYSGPATLLDGTRATDVYISRPKSMIGYTKLAYQEAPRTYNLTKWPAKPPYVVTSAIFGGHIETACPNACRFFQYWRFFSKPGGQIKAQRFADWNLLGIEMYFDALRFETSTVAVCILVPVEKAKTDDLNGYLELLALLMKWTTNGMLEFEENANLLAIW